MGIRITKRQLRKMVIEAIGKKHGSKEDNLSDDAKGGELSDPKDDYSGDDAEHALDTLDESDIYEDSYERENRNDRVNVEDDEEHIEALEKDEEYEKDHDHYRKNEGRMTTESFRRMVAQEIRRALKR